MDSLGTIRKSQVEDFITLKVASPDFMPDTLVPSRFTCEGENINPTLKIDHIPEETKSLAIIVEDPDAPKGIFVHWVIWNIPTTHHVRESEDRGTTGMNSYGLHRYDGPCPPSGTHRYYFKVYALDCSFSIPVTSDKSDLERAMAGHILGFGTLMGKYCKQGSAGNE